MKSRRSSLYSLFLNFRKENTLFGNMLVVASGKDLNGKEWFFNETAYEILRLCNGDKGLKDVVEELSSFYSGSRVEIASDVRNFILNGVKNGYITFNNGKSKTVENLISLDNRKLPSQPIESFLYSPLLVLFEITYACNLRCKHCYASAGKPMKDELNIDEIKKLANELGQMRVFDVAIGGGEPLLREDLPEVIRAFIQSNVEPVLVTNGTLFNEEIAEELWKSGLRKVQFSLDGASPEIHDSIRGVKGSFEKTVKAIEIAKSIGYSVAIKTIAQKENLNQLQDVAKLAYELAIDVLTINRAVPYGRAKENLEETFLPYKIYEESIQKLRKSKISLKTDARPLVQGASAKNRFATCMAGTVAIHICPNGDVKPCSYFPDSYVCGNIRERNLQDIWLNSEILKKLRSIHFNKLWEPCKSCNVMCNGGCRAAALSFFGDIYAPDPLCPIVQNKMLELQKATESKEFKVIQKLCRFKPEEYLNIKIP